MAIRKILVSQRKPLNEAPYNALSEKFGVTFDFRNFFLVEPLTSKEFRTQKINMQDHTGVIFSSRHAIDAYFKLCEELRVKVPETMKYFCTTEVVAMYLQKHIVYRKRKIFFGDGTPQSVLNQIGTKHKGEKFLVTQSDSNSSSPLTRLILTADRIFRYGQVIITRREGVYKSFISNGNAGMLLTRGSEESEAQEVWCAQAYRPSSSTPSIV